MNDWFYISYNFNLVKHLANSLKLSFFKNAHQTKLRFIVLWFSSYLFVLCTFLILLELVSITFYMFLCTLFVSLLKFTNFNVPCWIRYVKKFAILYWLFYWVLNVDVFRIRLLLWYLYFLARNIFFFLIIIIRFLWLILIFSILVVLVLMIG